jgi:uncharacterized protein (TIGR02444 family)
MNRPQDAAAEFWRFSLAFYAEPGAAAACLELQDRHGLDVNLALYGCWLGLSGRGRIDARGLAAADAAIADWRRSVIEPLRTVRRALKATDDAGEPELRERVKAAELEAERLCQNRLAALAPAPVAGDRQSRLEAAYANLSAYLGTKARGAGEKLIAALKRYADHADCAGPAE